MNRNTKPYWSAAELDALPERRHQHQFNGDAVRMTRTIGELAGLERIGIHLVRLQTGHDSTQFHYHDADEEFIYVVSGRGIAEIGEDRFEIAAGDFMGFTAPSPAHNLHNPYPEDLVYLMGGERNSSDLVHYPRIRRTLIKSQGKRSWVGWDDVTEID